MKTIINRFKGRTVTIRQLLKNDLIENQRDHSVKDSVRGKFRNKTLSQIVSNVFDISHHMKKIKKDPRKCWIAENRKLEEGERTPSLISWSQRRR